MANSSPKKKDQDWGIWALIIFLFAIGLSPIALLLLFIKLFGKDEETKKTSSSTSSEGGTRKTGTAKTARKTVRKAMKSPIAKRSTVRWLKIGGAALLLIGLLACMEPIDMMLWENRIVSYYMEDLVAAVAMAVGGILMLCNGVSMERSMKRYSKYLAVMGDRDAVAVKELARTLGYSARRVNKDLEKMIDRGYFGGKAYLHAELGYLLRSGDADAVRKQQQPVAAEPENETGYAAILQNIRRANDAIADPVLSAKIDRLEEISSRIFRIVEEDPQKRGKIETFLNYYLPTTQKLLDSYAQFEAAGVEGENLRQAKQRIEATMDSIVRGFEHQLDELYHADALDIDSDIRVMETMLRRDTATVEEDFGMGVMAQKMED